MNSTVDHIDWSAINPTERHYPRTLAEAFADERNPVIEVCAPRHAGDAAVGWALALAVVFLLAGFAGGWLQ